MLLNNNNHKPCIAALSFFLFLKSNHLSVYLSLCPSSGGSKDAGEARPAREQEHICTIRAECTVGAAGGRQRSDRRHPDQV